MDAIFGAFFTNSGSGATGLTVTLKVVKVAVADGTETVEVAAGSMSESANIDGLYTYRMAGVDPATYTYFGRATTAGTVDQADLPAQLSFVEADVVKISGDATAADNLEAAADGTGYNLGNGSIVAASVTGNVGGNVAGSVGSVTGNVGGNVAGSVGSVTGNVGGNVAGSVGSLAAQAKLDVNAEADTAIADAGLATAAALTTVGNNVTTILADTNELQTDWTNGGRLDVLVDAIKAKTDNLPDSPSSLALGDIMTYTLDDTVTFQEAVRFILAFATGVTDGANTSTLRFKDPSGASDRVVMTLDADGERLSVTLTGS